MKFLQAHLQRASNLGRRTKISIQLTADILLAIGCVPLALLLSGENLLHITDPLFFLGATIAIASALIAFAYFGLYRLLVRFITGNVLSIITKGVLIGTFVLGSYIIIFGVNIRLAVPFNYALILFSSIGGTRFLVRLLFQNPNQIVKKPALIYGAGEAGRELQNQLRDNHEILPVAFIDDNPLIQGLSIGNCRVYSESSFAKVRTKYGIELVLIALPSVSRQRKREIIKVFQGYNIEIKSIPPLSRILTGQALLSELHPIEPEMLLGRDSIPPIENLMRRRILGRTIMVTGAGGSIGAEICRQSLAKHPEKIILFDLSELALYQINSELTRIKNQTKSNTAIVPVLGSVNDKKCMADVIKKFSVDSIYHAAAYKHVPLLEDNVFAGINNNVFGTLTLVETATELGVDNFTLISTDKAVRPTNVMGASKRIAELICQAYASKTPKTKFAVVRFGNVLGSSGSVIPLFKKQIEAGGPITITHPDITRYFMTIPEASQLVIQASAMTEGKDIFVLDMGEPVKIVDLAREMVKLAGLKPYFRGKKNRPSCEAGYIQISFTGLRSGEKLHEELLVENNPQPTEHPRIFKASERSVPIGEFKHQLKKLSNACKSNDIDAALEILNELPLEFNHNRDGFSEHRPLSQRIDFSRKARSTKPL